MPSAALNAEHREGLTAAVSAEEEVKTQHPVLLAAPDYLARLHEHGRVAAVLDHQLIDRRGLFDHQHLISQGLLERQELIAFDGVGPVDQEDRQVLVSVRSGEDDLAVRRRRVGGEGILGAGIAGRGFDGLVLVIAPGKGQRRNDQQACGQD